MRCRDSSDAIPRIAVCRRRGPRPCVRRHIKHFDCSAGERTVQTEARCKMYSDATSRPRFQPQLEDHILDAQTTQFHIVDVREAQRHYHVHADVVIPARTYRTAAVEHVDNQRYGRNIASSATVEHRSMHLGVVERVPVAERIDKALGVSNRDRRLLHVTRRVISLSASDCDNLTYSR